MENNMFCYQCQETAKGIGCTLAGVCGKRASTSSAIDILLFAVRGVSVVADTLRIKGSKVEEKVNLFVTDALFSTITNANFDDESILKKTKKGFSIRNELLEQASAAGIEVPQVEEITWRGEEKDYLEKAKSVGVLREQNEDLRSLKELVLYGLKGMAAYHEHAIRLGFNDEGIHSFMQSTISQPLWWL